jgi:hypothetical protein
VDGLPSPIDVSESLQADGTPTVMGIPIVVTDYAPAFTGTTGSESTVAQRAAGANMSVDVAAVSVVIPGTDDLEQGKYLGRSSAVTTLPSPPLLVAATPVST